MRLSSLVTVAALVLSVPGVQAASPPNLQEALSVQQAQAVQHPNDPEILNDLGNLLVLEGSLGEAEEAYRRSLELAPENTTTRYNLALVLMEQGQGKQATKELQQLLEQDPGHSWALYQLGTLNASMGRRNKAVDYYTSALAANPELASPAVNPHIIENRYLTESQLRLYLAKVEAAQAPRLYQRPGEVAQLLIPSSDFETGPAQTLEPVSEPVPRPVTRTLTLPVDPGQPSEPAAGNDGIPFQESLLPPSDQNTEEAPSDPMTLEQEATPGQVEQGDESASSRVLTEADLMPTDVGQSVGSPVSPGQSSSSRSTARPGGTVSYPRTTTPRSGYSSGQAPPQPQSVSPRPQPAPRSQSFVPTIGSTGRLELEFLDEESSSAVAPGP